MARYPAMHVYNKKHRQLITSLRSFRLSWFSLISPKKRYVFSISLSGYSTFIFISLYRLHKNVYSWDYNLNSIYNNNPLDIFYDSTSSQNIFRGLQSPSDRFLITSQRFGSFYYTRKLSKHCVI